jgi:hypothetical protein
VRSAGDLTLAGVMDDLARSGFVEHFGVRGEELRSFDSGKSFRAGEVVVREFHRFEGASDPDDMAIVYAIEGEGGVRGTLVDAFGAYSDPAVSAFLARVRMPGASRSGGGTTGGASVLGRPGGIGRPAPAREPSRFGTYQYGFPAPVPSLHDEGGESGPVT